MTSEAENEKREKRGGAKRGGGPGRLADQLLSRHRYLRRQPATIAAATATSHPESQTQASFKYVHVGTKIWHDLNCTKQLGRLSSMMVVALSKRRNER